jgi:hypothetical protein
MDMPITPILDTKVEDNSATDESFNQQGNTVNIAEGGIYNQNCGNKKEGMTRGFSTFITIFISVCCILGLGYYQKTLVNDFKRESNRTHDMMQDEYLKLIKESNIAHDRILHKAKEGTMWLLRDDILKTIDLHSQTKVVTKKQYKCLKDEFDYYKSIGGNHDVEDKFNDFTYKILGTGEIKMVNPNQAKK